LNLNIIYALQPQDSVCVMPMQADF